MSSHPPGATRIIVVRTEACHLCDDAERALAELASTTPLDLEIVPLESGEGRRLVALHRPALAPLVLVDGHFFSSGRLPRKKLARHLAGRASRAEVVGAARDVG